MHIVVTGGSGLIGTHLCKALHQQGHTVSVVGLHRSPLEDEEIGFIQANLIQGDIPHIFSECDAIIHLAGANIFHRWNPSYQKLIWKSRVTTTEVLYDFLSKIPKRPHCFICASAVGFYGDRGEEILDEASGCGIGFLPSLCLEWEKAREKFSLLGMRTVSVRMATVLSREGGALSKMLPIFRRGLGGKLGKGTQWFPWIHIDDVVEIYNQALVDSRIQGAINAVAPELVRNREFTEILGAILDKPTFLSIPSWVLRLALGEVASVLLSSQKVVPKSLDELKFSFKHPTLQKALVACLQ